jgi:hypothetical protein
MTENSINGHHCPDNITLEERGAYASYVTRFKKQLPGGMTEREKRILSRFAEGGDIKNVDEFFRAHFEICPYCKKDYEQALEQEAIFTDDNGALQVRLTSDAAKEEGGTLIDLLDLTRKVRETRLKLEAVHGFDAKKIIDYIGRWVAGEVDVRNPDAEHKEMEELIISCVACRDYFAASTSLAGYSKKK